MSRIRVACQTYTWEMLGDAWTGKVTDILDAVAAAGYEGIEITNTMIREFAGRPAELAAELERRGLGLACFAYATSGFTEASALKADLAGADEAIAFVSQFPEPRLGLGGAASPSRRCAKSKLDRAITFYNEVGRRGTEAGVSVNVHPHSHFGSLLESAEEYQYLLDHLDPAVVSFGPDTGHIVRGGQDLMTCLRTHLSRITHLHLKDANTEREWVGLGQGVCDFASVLALLAETSYDGWVVGEEESAAARQDGVAAIRRNRDYLRALGY
ncbi:MAG: sugar phosphate isomerase/epimerase [Armatimonadetes bacterium]|nr:sugar phosphate isomerase/epimerase [Armatimonadota bacterium]